MKKLATLNTPAIWTPIPSDLMSVRKYEAFPYEDDKGFPSSATAKNPVYRYAMNFTSYGLDYSLCMFSKESSESKIKSYFNKLSKSLDKSLVTSSIAGANATTFTYVENEKYGGSK